MQAAPSFSPSAGRPLVGVQTQAFRWLAPRREFTDGPSTTRNMNRPHRTTPVTVLVCPGEFLPPEA